MRSSDSGSGDEEDSDICGGGGGDDDDDDGSPLCLAMSWLSLVGMVLYLLAFGIGMSPVPWTVNSEIYPTNVRAACMGIATCLNWVTNLAVALSFLTLEDAISTPGTFWLYCGFAAAGAAWLAKSMPETAGRSLEQIEQLFGPRASPEE